MTQLKREIRDCGGLRLNVLIGGETGTGKAGGESFTREGSPEQLSAVYLNCAALPESVAESGIWSCKGALPGAIGNRSGKVREMADNGTLFLDEIGELSLRPKYFACCSMAIFNASAATIVTCAWMCRCWRRPAVTCVKKRCWRGVSRRRLFHRLSVFPHLCAPALRKRGDDNGAVGGLFLRAVPTAAGAVPRGAESRRAPPFAQLWLAGQRQELGNMPFTVRLYWRERPAGDEVILEAQHLPCQDVLPAPPAKLSALPTCRNLRESTENQREMIRGRWREIII